MRIIQDVLSYFALHLRAEYVAFFSVVVTIIIYILNKNAEIKIKKYERNKEEYSKLMSILSMAFTNPESLELDGDGKLNSDIQKQFYDAGASMMLYASKKLYKEYLFFRDFSSSSYMKLLRYYDQNMIIYIVANMMRQIRKEVGLSAFNNISANEALGYFVNDLASNPNEKKKACVMNYRIRMLKMEIFLLNRIHCVDLFFIYYSFIKPLFGMLYCVVYYFFIYIPFHIFCKIVKEKLK